MIRLSITILASVLVASAAYAQDCSSVGDNQINDALVQQLRQQADNAEKQAQIATNPQQRARWEMVAQNLRSQADNAESREQSLAQAAQQICQAAAQNNNTSNDGSSPQ